MTNKDFFAALDALEKEKGISKEYFLESLQTALATAYKRNFGEVRPVEVVIDESKYSIDMYILPRKSATYNFVKKQFAMIDIPLENRILECFIRFKIMNFDNKNRGIVPLNFYIGIALLDSDVIRLEYCEFLTNSKLALNGKIPGLENISQADLVQYAKWLLSQKCKYDNIQNQIPQ